MKQSLSRVLLAFLSLALVATACGGDDGSLEVENARYRLGRPDLGAAYLELTNTTGEDVTIQSASAEGVGRIELHETFMGDDGAMTMEEATEGFTIADGETLVLEPGGKHLMIFDPEGTEDLDIVLDFGDDTIEFVATYDAEASAGTGESMNTDDMDHGDMEDMEDDSTADEDG